MEFGRIESDELTDIDFTLPADTEQTFQVLNIKAAEKDLDIRIGCTRWGHKTWPGNIYPKQIKESEFLNEYVKHFNSVELKATFYTLYEPEKIAVWKEQTSANPDFKFYPLMPQNISHIRRLKNAGEITARYIRSIRAFEEKLGPSILQLGENFSYKSYPELVAYLESLPINFDMFVELRHKDWFTSEWFTKVTKLLQHHQVGFVITDTAGRRECVHMNLTVPKAYIRFSAAGDDEIDKKRLGDWATRILKWKSEGLHSVAFFISHPDDERKSPEFCAYLTKKLS